MVFAKTTFKKAWYLNNNQARYANNIINVNDND